MAKVFVTGATGQVGMHVVEYILLNKKLGVTSPSDIICLVRNPKKAQALKQMNVTIVKGELQDSDTISEVMTNGIDFVFHVAANILLNQTYNQMYAPNVLGTRIMLDAFVKSQAKCIIYTSSIAVYEAFNGKKRYYNIDENSPLGDLKGEPYQVTKRIAENLVRDYAKKNPNKTIIITRLGPIIGAGDRQTIPAVVEVMKFRFLPKLINRGKHLFALTSARDVARGQVFLAEYSGDISGEIYNIAHEPISYRRMMNVIADYYQKRQPKFSITYWFFKSLLPLLRVLHKIFPTINLIKIALSPITVKYVGKTYIYNSEKLEKLGFEYKVTPEEAIIDTLVFLDPEKKMMKPSWRLKRKIKQN
ncbi:MAG: NAD-dependent epimerase/dehydratase family protein [Candidatus Heimdallarchaeota archaeon]|nr:NAD-dependent epimerase/dehydratase family protein [Candidatus Heimdallarchaeota archaeon]MBY8996040.1 NAD-dependent epimerase/dehydratase family protein [Candidatus Heimdallarchaeota archaeon]